MKMSKKLFILLIVAMVLVTLSIIVLVVTGHEALVRDVFQGLEGLGVLVGTVFIILTLSST